MRWRRSKIFKPYGEGDVRAENVLSQTVWYGSQERRKLRVQRRYAYVSDECRSDPANAALIQQSLTPELYYLCNVSLLVTDQVQCSWPWLMTVILLCGSAMIWCSQRFCGHHYFQSSLQQLPLTVLNWPRLVRVAFWATWGSSTPLHTLRRPRDCYRITIAYHESRLRLKQLMPLWQRFQQSLQQLRHTGVRHKT